jgi:hypothetical protein
MTSKRDKMPKSDSALMGRLSIAALLLLTFPVAEKVYAAPEALPCAEEIATYCGQVQPGAGRILGCLNAHQADLSDVCKEKLRAASERLRQAKQACAGDVDQFCSSLRPGEGRILRCLQGHAEQLSAACKAIVVKVGSTGKQGQPGN